MGMPLMRKDGIRRCASHIQGDKSGRSPARSSARLCSMQLQLSEAPQSSTDHRSVGWIESDCEAGEDGTENERLRSVSSSAFSQRDRGSALVKIRKVGDGKRMGAGRRERGEWGGGGGGGGQDSSPRSPISSHLYHWDPPQHSSVSICRWKINNLFRRPSFSSEETSSHRSGAHFPRSYHSVFSL